LLQRSFTVAKFGRDVDFDRQARKPLEPVFGDQPGVIGGAARGYRDPLERAKIERRVVREPHPLGRHVEIVRERVADDLRLLVDLLRHEVAIICRREKPRPTI
jgi:hypothetical protein